MKKKIIWIAALFVVAFVSNFSIQFHSNENKVSLKMLSVMAQTTIIVDDGNEDKNNCSETQGFCAESAGGGEHCVSIIDPYAMCN